MDRFNTSLVKMAAFRDEMLKIADVTIPTGNISAKTLATLAAGGALYHYGRKMKNRYDMGKAMDQQQQGY